MNENIMSCSMIVDNGYITNDFNQLQARPLILWQEDSSANQCFGCNTKFGYLTWKHHCRHCGYIFCNKCTSKSVTIPDFLKLP